ncbi:extracellular solute-binding protein [Lachnoclostridium sp. Marseille-P6806]|uniref:extracellular solute-binding protein n=1 Tax=Lachnoclostridium sp. Marseille-P6806 TaxID=2364793 RepID=UPI0010305B93|nr:extracellular solute-binding protein [Lachnoclostridium sp. Marseille-P6806]
MKNKALTAALSSAVAVTLLAGCGSGTASGTGQEATADTAAAEETAEAETEEDAPQEEIDYGTGEIKVWVADNAVDFTNQQIKAFQEANPDFSGYSMVVEATGEGDAAGNMITDVEAGADIYVFAQDQIARLVSAGALEEVAPENVEAVKAANDAGAVAAATVGDILYAYPLTSDNGYFMYYDKSVVKDPSDLDAILADCEAAGKSFYMEINSGWYQTAFFFGTGCTLSYETDNDGNFTAANVDYASDAGVVALKEMIHLNNSPAFVNGSSVGAADAAKMAAIVDGTWDAQAAKDALGDNYACAKLPSFKGADGKTYQLSGFSGYKLLGVKPQEDEGKLMVCDALAQFLSGGEVQLARYESVGWGPSNLEVQKSEKVMADEALTALNEQMLNDVPQGQYPGDYWTLATGLGDSVINGEISDKTSDADLLAKLQEFQDTCISYAK